MEALVNGKQQGTDDKLKTLDAAGNAVMLSPGMGNKNNPNHDEHLERKKMVGQIGPNFMGIKEMLAKVSHKMREYDFYVESVFRDVYQTETDS